MTLFAGMGMGLIYTAAIVSVNLSFERYRPIANGSVLATGGVGIMLLPAVCRFMLETYSWRETLFIFCLLSAQLVVAGALLYPLAGSSPRSTACCRWSCLPSWFILFLRTSLGENTGLRNRNSTRTHCYLWIALLKTISRTDKTCRKQSTDT